MTNIIPRLCGGTFLTLLLQAVKPHNRSHVTIKSGKVRLSNSNVFRALIKVFDSTGYLTDGSSFNTLTSKYKNCNKVGDSAFRYRDDDIISAFNQEILTNYHAPLQRMVEFVETYIDVETPVKYSWLARAILELILSDDSIPTLAAFYVTENGSILSKAQLTSITEITLESLLLGVWHFILMNRPENTIGKETIEAWHSSSSLPNAQKDFISLIGKESQSELTVYRTIDILGAQDTFDNPEVEIVEVEVSNDSKTTKEKENNHTESQTLNQTMNVFNQFGNGNTQIGSVGTFINK